MSVGSRRCVSCGASHSRVVRPLRYVAPFFQLADAWGIYNNPHAVAHPLGGVAPGWYYHGLECAAIEVAPAADYHGPPFAVSVRAPLRNFNAGDTMPVALSLSVNGRNVTADVDARTLLVDFLRNDLGLTGTHVGCDTGQCGACTVHLDGNAIKSCTILAAQANGAAVLTIEGVAAADGTMHPMQAAFKECHGLQCGFCTPGMVMNAIDLATRHPGATEQTIREELEGNLCRCTGYRNIVKAVRQGSAAMAALGARRP
jgi:aerobic carbon-monoxide dehydrogenase small subunit